MTSEREEFEAVAKQVYGWNPGMFSETQVGYCNPAVHHAWCVWQAARRTPSAEAATVDDIYYGAVGLCKNEPDRYVHSLTAHCGRFESEDAARGAFIASAMKLKAGFSVHEVLVAKVAVPDASQPKPSADERRDAERWRAVRDADPDSGHMYLVTYEQGEWGRWQEVRHDGEEADKLADAALSAAPLPKATDGEGR
jgi:hypothetical protein